MWKQITKHGAIARLMLVVGSLGVLVSGVTFAALQSQNVMLTGNTISTASAGLLIGTASATSTAYSATHTGFSFAGVIPGGPPVPVDGNKFYLKNNGTSPLTLRMTIGSTPTNSSNIDLSKVFVIVTRSDNNNAQTATLQSLIDGYPSGGLVLADPLTPATSGVQYTIAISMNNDAFNGNTSSISGIDFVFSGSSPQPAA